MAKNQNKKSNNNVLLQSRFIDIFTSNVHLTAYSSKFSFETLGSFINAFLRHNRVKIHSSNRYNLALKFSQFFVACYLLHDSRFVKHLFSNKVFVTCPSFTIIHILKVAIESKTRNKLAGFTDGILYPSSSLSDIISYLKILKPESIVLAFRGTEFSSFINDEDSALHFRNSLVLYLQKQSNGKRDYDFIVESLAIPQNIVLYPDRFQLFRGYLEFGVSQQLGIYRFRNLTDNSLYTVNQGSIEGLSLTSFNLFINFISLFKPSFYISDKKVSEHLYGDVIFQVDNIPTEESWFEYMNVTFEPTKFQNQEPKVTTNNTDSTETTEPDIIDGHDSNSFKNISICQGDSKYFKILNVYDIENYSPVYYSVGKILNHKTGGQYYVTE